MSQKMTTGHSSKVHHSKKTAHRSDKILRTLSRIPWTDLLGMIKLVLWLLIWIIHHI